MTLVGDMSQALSERELDELAKRLEYLKNPESLSLEGVDGLFCALIASPQSVPPSGYVAAIVGDLSGQRKMMASPDDANLTLSLLLRYWNSILHDLEKDSIHEPFVRDVGPGLVPGRAWAQGFMRGTDLAPEGWDELFEDEGDSDCFAIPLISGEINPEWPTQPVTKDLQDEIIRSLAVGFARSYQYFAQARHDNAVAQSMGAIDEYYPETFVRPEPKVGRNDPCPCGSGKKFKKCCGASGVGAH